MADGDEVLYASGFGEANRSWGTPNAPDTRFRIGSVTKQFTAALVLQLAEQGLVDLDAPIRHYLPDYPAPQGDRVTVHQLLSHTSGIPEHVGQPGFADLMRDPVAPDSFLAVFSGRDLEFEPGRQFNYTNSGYYVLGVLIERLTGQSYAEALQARLLGPLGLTNSGYDNGATIVEQAARGYTRAGNGYQHAPYFDPSVPYAAGMIYSTAHDLFRWTRALHAATPFEASETLDQMITPVLNDYAYGLGVSDLAVGGETVRAIGHDGSVPGFSAFVVYFPDEARTVVALDNAQGGTRTVALNVARVLYGQPVPSPSQAVGSLLESLIESEGIDAAEARYRDLLAHGGAGYDIREGQLNNLGYLLLERGETETAIRIFALNVDAYPDSWNPYDSLGEAYLVAGDTARSIASYQEALLRYPGATSAREALERLGADATSEGVIVAVPTLERYVGRYALVGGPEVEVTREGPQLFAEPEGEPRFTLVPMNDRRFYIPRVDAYVTFDAQGDGPAPALTLEAGPDPMRGERVK
ncbi:MAG: serine hydrolase [Bacteroidota bacterium]